MLGGPARGSFKVTYDVHDDILRLEYIGRMTSDLTLVAADATFTIPGIGAGTRVLAVYLKAEIDEIDLAALIAYQAYKADKGYPNLPAATVVADIPGHLAMAALWAATKPGGRDGGAGVFTDEASARAWLLAGRCSRTGEDAS